MLNMTPEAGYRLGRVREECARLDAEHPGIELTQKLEKALAYAARFGDQELEGKSLNLLVPDHPLAEGDTMDARHFSFMVYCQHPDADGRPLRAAWFTLGMIYHNGAGFGDGSLSVDFPSESGPHWSFHS